MSELDPCLGEPGSLFVVATPIGNLNDITFRAVEVLKSVHCVAAEDTRHTRSLLQHFGINKPLLSLHDHNEEQRSHQLISRIRAGENIALVSDAGTPLISDPGYRVVTKVREAAIRVVPIPGACAAIAALCASGLPTDRFRFIGFLPARSHGRREALRELVDASETLVFYESPRRLLEMLGDVMASFGAGRRVAVAKELTKLHERIFSGTLDAAMELFQDETLLRGEFVVLVEGAGTPAAPMGADDARAMEWMRAASEYLPPRQAASLVASISGADKKVLYRRWAARAAGDMPDNDAHNNDAPDNDSLA
jgi:16S rRNA (cytidine1402-2'-O)-methyltransferase